MGEEEHLGPGEGAAVDQALVALFVQDEHVSLSQETLDGADVPAQPAGVQQAVFLLLELRQPSRELHVQVERPGEKRGPGCAQPVAIQGFLCRLDDLGMR